MKTFLTCAVLIDVMLCLGCGKSEPPPNTPPAQAGPAASPAPVIPAVEEARIPFVSARDGRFIDSEGRQIILHGMAVISKNPSENYQSWHGPQEFALLREWGMNCIRLGILWDGLEPKPGVYDEEYLKKVDQRIEWARSQGLYVLLDMHQDLFSVKYGDGAPRWATLDEGLPHKTGAVWSDAYMLSDAVKKSLDNFWANTRGPDGAGIQDRFALAWQHVARRYADDTTILGYDLFNEPNEGSGIPALQGTMIGAFVEAVTAKDGVMPDLAELGAKWTNPEGRKELMTRLREIDIYTKVVDAPGKDVQDFERAYVVPMFKRVTDAIRAVDKNHLVFLETLTACNMGVRTGIEPVRGAGGARDPRQAFAPHGYDIVVDTAEVANASNERLELIFSRHAESGKRLNMPVLIGEWGAYYGGVGNEILPIAWFTARQFEKHLFSDTYWSFEPYVINAPYLPVLSRAIPACIAGTLLSYENNPETNAFSCAWQEDPGITAPSRIYLPQRCLGSPESITLEPAAAGFTLEPAGKDTGAMYAVIPPTGQSVGRRLTVKP